MDDQRFDFLVKRLHVGQAPLPFPRRAVLRWAIGALTLLGFVERRELVEAKKRKKRRKRRCVPNCVNRFCGPNSCGQGSCGTCGACKNCEGGQCVQKANGAPCGGACEECQDGTCVPKPAKTNCGACKECEGASCVSVCEGSEVCFAGACEDLSGECAGSSLDTCVAGPVGQCTINGAGGQCVKLDDGSPFCHSELECSLVSAPICQTTADCIARGFGAHAQCITACDWCGSGGLPACVRLAGE